MTFNKVISEICDEKGIKYDVVSNDWIWVLEKDNVTRFVSGYHFDVNRNSVATVLDDKFALYDVLNLFNYPIIKHHLFYKDYDKNEVKELFETYNKAVVVKPNLGTCGEGVYYVTDLKDLYEKMDSLFPRNLSVSLCPYYEIKKEYRVIVLEGKVKLIYAKIKPEVTGDGKCTIKKLLEKFNYPYFSKIDLPDKVLKKGEKYTYCWQFNLSKGAISSLDIADDIKEKLTSIALEVVKKIGITFCSVDIIDCEEGFLILEMNSGVMIKNFIEHHENGYDIAKGIYSEAIDLLFK